MSPGTFLFVLVIGGGAIALWIAVHFPEVAPRTLRGALIHLGLASVLVVTATPLLGFAVGIGGAVAATISIALPEVVYLLLSGVWFVALAQREGASTTL